MRSFNQNKSLQIKEKPLSDVTSQSFRLSDDQPDWDTENDFPVDRDTAETSVFDHRRKFCKTRPLLGIGDRQFPKDSIMVGDYDNVHINRPVISQHTFDELYEENVTSGQTMRFIDNIFMPRKERRNCLDLVLSIFPLVNVLRSYNFKKSLPFDILSGITTGVMRIPQSMAYALLTHLTPEYGLYTAFFSAIFYTVFGGSPHIVAGAQGVVALIIGDGVHLYSGEPYNSSSHAFDPTGSLSNRRVEVAITLTFMIGLIQCLLGVFRFGFVTNYLSDPLIGGFTTAAAVTVIITQMPMMLGFTIPIYSGKFNLGTSVYDIFKNISKTNYITVLIAIFSLLVLSLCKYLTYKFIKKIKVPIPGELIIMIAMIIFSHFLNIEKKWNVTLVGKIKQGFPAIKVPNLHIIQESISVSISGAIISFTIAYSVAKRLAVEHDYDIDGNREVFAFGFTNMMGSFFNIFAATASMTGSALHDSLGGVSQLANIVASILVLFTFLFIGKLFEPLPECVLSSVILVNLKSILFQFRDLKTLWKVSKFDLLLWSVTFLAVIIVSVNIGLLIGVSFSLLTVIFRTQWPYSCLLGRIPSTDIYKNVSLTPNVKEIPGIKIIRFEGSLYFASAEHFRSAIKHVSGINPSNILKEQQELEKQLQKVRDQAVHFLGQNDLSDDRDQLIDHNAIQFNEESVHHLIIDFSTCGFIDSVGIRTLTQVIKDFKTVRIIVFLANIKSAVRAMLIDSNVFYQKISTKHIFLSVHDAVLGALEDERFIEERDYLIKDSTIKSRVRFISKIASDTELSLRNQ